MNLHPVSHSTLINTNKVCASPGTICASLAFLGSHRRSSLRAWIDFICSPSGKLIVKGLVADRISVTGAPGKIKCPVAPLSDTG